MSKRKRAFSPPPAFPSHTQGRRAAAGGRLNWNGLQMSVKTTGAAEVETTGASSRVFTCKSILFSLLGILIISSLAYFAEVKLGVWTIVNQLPPAALVYIFFVSLVWNGICARFAPRLVLNYKELVVVLATVLISCGAVINGFLRWLPDLFVQIWNDAPLKTMWIRMNILENLPLELFPSGEAAKAIADARISRSMENLSPEIVAEYERVHGNFIHGMAKGNDFVWDFPVMEWIGAVGFWLAVFLALIMTLMGMVLLVQRQWVRHEQLPYPLASITDSLIRKSPGRMVSDALTNPLFWFGFGPVALISLLNWFGESFPGTVPVVPLSWSVAGGVLQDFPSLRYAGGLIYAVLSGSLSFMTFAVAYFVSSEVGLTLWITPVIAMLCATQYYLMTGTPVTSENLELMRSGGFVAYALILLYIGRNYYFPVIFRAFGLGFRDRVFSSDSIFAARILVLGFIAFIISLMVIGLTFPVALLFAMGVLILYLVTTRILCEAGLYYFTAGWQPEVLLVKLLGPAAIGTAPLCMLYLVGSIFTTNTQESTAGYLSTSYKVTEDAGISLKKMFFSGIVAFGIALCIGFFALLWTNFNLGIEGTRGATPALDRAAADLFFLEDTGTGVISDAASSIGRFAQISLSGPVVGWFSVGLLGVLFFFLLRLRFVKFPLHPLLFLIVGVNWFMYSFFFGWLVKQLVLRYGGGKIYQKLKPLVVGILMGELGVRGFMALFSIAYYMLTGDKLIQ